MADYPISVSIDPANAVSGGLQVKQTLAGIAEQAAGTKASVQQTADAIGASLDKVGTKATAAGGGVDTLAKSALDLGKSADTLKGKVTGASDSIGILSASSLAGANNLRNINTRLTELYSKTGQADQGTQQFTKSAGQQRQGVIQLGEQFRQFATEVQLGISPVQALAQQSGQAAFALSNMGGTAGKVGDFLASGYGTLILVATTAVIGFIAQNIKLGNALDDNLDKLKKEAAESDVAGQAKVRFAGTLEGVTKAIYDERDALKKLAESDRDQAEQDAINAKNQELITIKIRERIVALLEVAKLEQDARAAGDAQQEVPLGRTYTDAKVERLQKQLDQANSDLAQARANVAQTQANLADDLAKKAADPVERVKREYEGPTGIIAQTKARLLAEKATLEVMTAQLAVVRQREAVAIAAAQKEKHPHVVSDGVERFRSAQQAIGIAGRELQRDGLRVGENPQFGGVTPGAHKGLGHANGTAIDVNEGTGVTEADVPDLRAKFNALALRYQSRGFTVLWNGKRYEANGNGPTGPIRGSDQHRDHMHVEAPQTIVGKPTRASEESQAERDAKVADQQQDFVQSVIDQASTRGQGDRTSLLTAQIDRVFAEYKKRFNVALDRNSPEGKRITGALTDAEAREQADHFQTAYVDPLDALRAAAGKTGEELEIFNRQTAERTRLGRDLTAVEKQEIADFVKQGDALKRQAAILEDVRKPLDDYKKEIAALNALLATGAISQTTFNARVRALPLVRQGRDLDRSLGKRGSDKAAKGDVSDKEADDLDLNEKLFKAGLKSREAYEKAATAIKKKGELDRYKIDQARKDQQLESAQGIADTLLQITADTIGKNNALYKGLFIAEKAVAIARSIVAIETGVAEAAAEPFPLNLAAMATVVAATASIISNISAVTLNLAEGGLVRGPGGPTSDSVAINGSAGEFMVKASAVAQPGHLALLEAMNSGALVGQARASSTTSGGAVSAGGGASRVMVQQHPGVAIEVRENRTDGDIEIIAKRAVEKHAPTVVAADMNRPNSRTSKAITRTTTARGRKK